MANEPGRIVAPSNGQSIDLTPKMWEGFQLFVQDHSDYLQSGTADQQALYKRLVEGNIVKTGETSGR